MADDTLPNRGNVTFDFNLPHGIDVEEIVTQNALLQSDDAQGSWSFDGLDVTTSTSRPRENVSDRLDASSDQCASEKDLDYRRFSRGFSDDEGSSEAFDRSWPSHQAKKQTAKIAKGKKSPRRSESECEGSRSSLRAKKLRKSLFSGNDEEMELNEQVDIVPVPLHLGYGIRNRMSSMNIDQQQIENEDTGTAVTTGFDLASSDIGSVRNSSVPSDDEFVIPQDTVPYYELRQNIDRKKAVTHVDTDKSGNFDPEQETRERIARSLRTKAAKKEKTETRKKKGNNVALGDYNMKCIVQLPFESFGNVRNHTNDEQNWPDDWSEIDSGQERELDQYREHYRANTPHLRRQLPLDDPAGKTDDLTGQPTARGCKQCRQFEKACSLIEGGKYPCEECIEDDAECHTIQEPTIKGRCKQCNQANIGVCSLENDPTQPVCDHCAEDDHICEALPPHGYKAPRLTVDEIIWGPDRPFISCTTCRGIGKRCSLKSKKAKPPCNRCYKGGQPCRFVDPPKPRIEQQQTVKGKTILERVAPEVSKPGSEFFTEEDLANMHQRNNEIRERELTPEIEMEGAEGNKGMLTKITTSFAHPIRFGAKRSDVMDCNFCEIPVFGMFGHFEREVHVVRWHSGSSYAEIGGGHAQNEGPTAMCDDCTNQRLQIMVCPGHEFEDLPDASLDHDALAEELTDTEPGGADMQYQLSRWCSMCFSPAVFGCSTVQSNLCGEEEREIAGCHLRLCLACEVALRTKYEGNFDAMTADLDSLPKISEADETLGRKIEGRPRADVGLLLQNGLLMRAVQADG